MTRPQIPQLVAARYALLAMALAFGWQYFTVQLVYDGAWSALYLTGDAFDVPEQLAHEGVYQFPGTYGYDGQFYHYIAHDPLLTKGLAEAVDAPGLRWRRILVPGLAAILSLGRSAWVDGAYMAVVYGFIGAGVYWLSLIALLERRDAAWGLWFLVIPATAISVERLTVDVAVAAIAVGYGYYALRGRDRPTWILLALAPLARETGIVLLVSHAALLVMKRRWATLSIACLAALPFLGWAVYVATQTSPSVSGWVDWPLSGLVERSTSIFPVRTGNARATTAMLLDYIGLIGVWIALILTARVVWSRFRSGWDKLADSMGPVEWALAFFALSAVMLGSAKVWWTTYSYARVLSPWLVFLTIMALRDRKPLLLVPTMLMAAHVGAQAAVHALAMCRNLLGVA